MPRFQWILTSLDNQTTYTLQKDPVGWDTCAYRMERHATYKGIFNQFTSSLKFHNQGGGKQWVDNIYKTYDIDANVTITINIDSDGTGLHYDNLFTGKLNFASYTEDGTFTTLNIEQSDIFTKLNTRADIPVPLNLVSVKAGFYSGAQWLSFGFTGSVMDTLTDVSSISSYTFFNPYIQPGNTFYLQTIDENQNPLTLKQIFNGADNPVTPTGGINTSPGGVMLSIIALAPGEIQIQFSNLKGPVILYMGGTQQFSLGQQAIASIPTTVLPLNGVSIPYQSSFTLSNDSNSGTAVVIPSPPAGWLNGVSSLPISVVVYDVNNNAIYDQVTFTGADVSGPGMSSANGLTSVHITHITAFNISINFTNAYGFIDIFSGEISSITGGTGTPGNVQPLVSYPPSAGASTQQFINPPDGSTVVLTEPCGGFITFDAFTAFDNLDEFVFGQHNNLAANLHAAPDVTTSTIPAIFTGLQDPYIQYPVTINVSITLKGTVNHSYTAAHWGLPGGETNNITLDFFLFWGGGNATLGTTPLAAVPPAQQWHFFTATGSQPNHDNITVNIDDGTGNPLIQTKSIQIAPGDQVWLFAKVTSQFSEGSFFPLGTGLFEDYTFQFTQSLIDFKIASQAPATTAQGIMIHEAFNQVIDCIADSDGNFYSQYYGRVNSAKQSYAANGPGSLRALTNGLCIRGHLDKYISLSLNDIFTSTNAIDNIGLEIDANNRVRIEPLSFFFDRQTQILLLPNVNTYETLNENSYYINQIEVGYNKWETEIYFKNGLDEVHAKRLYATRVGAAKGTVLQNYSGNTNGFLKVSGKLSAISKFIAGNYTIELTRRKNLQWSQDDFKYDNDNFIICLTNQYNGGINFQTTNTAFLYGAALNILPGDNINILNAGINNGSYKISASTVIGGNSTLVTVAATFPGTGIYSTAFATFDRSTFIETGSLILQQPAQNVIDPALTQNWLNMSITPARMLQAQMNRITAGLQTIQGKTQFIGGSGNFQCGTQMFGTGAQQDYTGNLLYENTSFNYNDPNIRNITPLWLPEVYRFQYPITYQQFKQIRANPNGFVTFYKFSNDVKFGFILSMDYELKTGLTKFELLRMNPPESIEGVLNEDGTYIII